MKTYRADFHIHTVLSPCGSLEMSPANIVSLANQRGLDMIGITDHNSTLQCKMVWQLAQNTNLKVIAGCEATSQEEVHCLALFEDFDALSVFQDFVEKNLLYIPNDRDLFGYQVVVDENDNIVDEIEPYLGSALIVSIDEIEKKVHELSGLFIPAHIDRPRNSLFSQLAFIPQELEIDALQISKLADETTVRNKYGIGNEFTIVKFSDAHYPEDIGKTFTIFEMNAPTFAEVKKALARQDGRTTRIP